MDKVSTRRVAQPIAPKTTAVQSAQGEAAAKVAAGKGAEVVKPPGWAAKPASPRPGTAPATAPGPTQTSAPVIADKAKAPANPSWYSGLTDAFSHASTSVQKTVSSAVTTAEAKVSAAANAVSDAGHAVQDAGREVLSAAGKVVGASSLLAGDVGKVVAAAARTTRDAGEAVTSAGQAAFHAGKAALTGDPKDLDAAKAAVANAQTAVGDAKLALTDAGKHVQDAGKQVKIIGGAIDQADRALDHAGKKLETASGKIDEAIAAVTSAPAKVALGLAQAVDRGGTEVRQAIEKMPGGNDMLQGAQRLAKGGQDVNRGLSTLNPLLVAKGLGEQALGVVDFGKGVADSPVVPWAKEKLVDYANGFNPEKQVAALEKGQSYSLKLGAGAHIEFGVEAAGSLNVKAEKDGTFTVDALAVAGVNARLEPEKMGEQGESAVARALLGGKAQFKCANKEEALKLTKILAKAGAAASNPVMAPLVGLTKEDLSFLKTHATSVEVSGKLAGQIGVDLHVPLLSEKGGLKLEAGASAQRAVRIDLENGKPTGLTLADEVALDVTAGVGLKLPPKLDESGTLVYKETSIGLEGKIGGKLTRETHFDLPKNASLDALLVKPGETLLAAGEEMRKSRTESVSVAIEGDGKIGVPLLNKKGSFAADFTLRKKGAPLDGATLNKLLHGDLAGAAGDGSIEFEGSARTVTKKKWGGEDMGLSIAGVGVEVTALAEKTTESPPFYEKKWAAEKKGG